MSNDLRVGYAYLTEIRREFLEDGDVLVYGGKERGGSDIDSKEKVNTKLTREKMLEIKKFIDDHHTNGKAVVSRDIRDHLFQTYGLECHCTTVGREVDKIGLSWEPIYHAKRHRRSLTYQNTGT